MSKRRITFHAFLARVRKKFATNRPALTHSERFNLFCRFFEAYLANEHRDAKDDTALMIFNACRAAEAATLAAQVAETEDFAAFLQDVEVQYKKIREAARKKEL